MTSLSRPVHFRSGWKALGSFCAGWAGVPCTPSTLARSINADGEVVCTPSTLSTHVDGKAAKRPAHPAHSAHQLMGRWRSGGSPGTLVTRVDRSAAKQPEHRTHSTLTPAHPAHLLRDGAVLLAARSTEPAMPNFTDRGWLTEGSCRAAESSP
jgi:hypothetical protein